LELSSEAIELCTKKNYDLQGYSMSPAAKEQLRKPRIVRIGAIQNSIVLPTIEPLVDQRDAIFKKIDELLYAASLCKVNIVCLQEAWTMPFAFCTREKQPWCELAESAEDGPSTKFLKEKAKQYNMIIVSPILERENEEHGETLWNTAVVISSDGTILGKSRKNHIPRVGDFNEVNYGLFCSIIIHLLKCLHFHFKSQLITWKVILDIQFLKQNMVE
jgi:beta-ureidopropionase